MEIKAKLNYLHISPRKVRLVANLVRGMDVRGAELELRHVPKRGAQPLLKLLKSAVANAKHNFDLGEDALYIKKITVNPGSVSKKFRARAFGRAAPIRKRTSHVWLELGERQETERSAGREKIKKAGPFVRDVTSEDVGERVKLDRRPMLKEIPVGTRGPGFVRRMFRRKAI